MSKDTAGGGTASGAAGSTGWNLPVAAKTGTTESHMSSAFLGFTNRYAGSVYTYGDSPTPGQICANPVRPCYDGNLFGGTAPAHTWFTAMSPVATKFGSVELPPTDPRYVRGAGNAQVPDVTGLSRDRAVQRLQDAGFSVSESTTKAEERAGTVTGSSPSGSAVPGSTVTIFISDGSVRAAPTTSATPARPSGSEFRTPRCRRHLPRSPDDKNLLRPSRRRPTTASRRARRPRRHRQRRIRTTDRRLESRPHRRRQALSIRLARGDRGRDFHDLAHVLRTGTRTELIGDPADGRVHHVDEFRVGQRSRQIFVDDAGLSMLLAASSPRPFSV